MTISVIELPKTTPPYKEGIPLYHRSGDKPLDFTTLIVRAVRLARGQLLSYESATLARSF